MPQTNDIRITIRFKPDEYAVLEAKAGNRPVSRFVRELTLDKAAMRRKPTQSAPIKDKAALALILALLGQHDLVKAFKAAEAATGDGIVPASEEARDLARECRDLLARIHKLLMRALGVAIR